MLGNEDPNTLKRTRTNPLDHSGEAHPEAHGQHDLAFDNEFSRLIGAIGKEALLRMHQSKVFISGVKGIGIEIAKNLALMGVRSLTLHDPEPVGIADLSSNFFLSEADVGHPRADRVVPHLQQLHERVLLKVHSGDLSDSVLKEYQVVVITNGKSRTELLRINSFCHANGIRFIATDTLGLFGYIFTDFGSEWAILDPTGEEPKSCFAESITQDQIGLVTVAHGERHDFEDGDVVRVSEVKGMTELNDKVFSVTVKSPFSFSIGDTSGFSSYISGGSFEQVKAPKTISHQPLSFFYEEGNFPFDKAVLMDYSKFDRVPQYNLFLQAVLQFREENGGKLPAPRNQADAEKVLSFAKAINDKRTNDKVDEVNDKLIIQLAQTARGDLSPMATIFGGVVAQEVIKGTAAKYTPIDQWFLYESLECLAADDQQPSEADCAPKGSRYDGQIAVFGSTYQEKLQNLKYFLVGAGAIGCEVLKCWAMMGVSAGPEGSIQVTDMDQIEISNLNRQFLYRPWDVSKFKSEVAANAAKKMNSDMKIHAWTNKVGPETESTFNDDFWRGLSGVCNALDNVQARLYVDSRCVFYGKSLLESGTLGTKGNTQVIVPYLTESYGSSRDPPTKETPMCTLHFFPNNIQHCLQWAREDLFEGNFSQNPELINQYIEKPNFLSTISPQQKKTTLEKMKSLLLTDKPKTFDDCISWARLEFEIHYNHKIRQLLYNFPADFVDQHGVPFWSGAKRPPTPIEFDVNNQLHLDFIVFASYLRAYTYGLIESEFKPIDLEETIEHIKKFVVTVKPPAFVPQKVKIPTQTDGSDANQTSASFPEENEDELIEQITKALPKPQDLGEWRARAVIFEKDDDKNFHIDFITAASNLRASAYLIPTADRLKSKLIAGKIVPAIVTTTAVVTGFVQLEFYKLHQSSAKPIEQYRNSFINLALPLFQQSEPIPPPKRKYVPKDKDFTLWDRIEIREGDLTLQQLLEWFQKNEGIEVDMISAGTALIYSRFTSGDRMKQRLPRSFAQLVQEISKQQLQPNQTYFPIEVAGSTTTGDDVEDMPDVFFFFK